MSRKKIIMLLPEDVKHDEGALQLADTISALDFVEKVVCLPDFHWKPTMEAPSSFAAVTSDYIVPHFSSSSLNCGMGLVNSGISLSQFNEQMIKSFFSKFCETEKRIEKYDISHDELLTILKNGASVLIKKLSLPEAFNQRIESEGSCLTDQSISKLQIKGYLHPDDLKNPNYIGLKSLGLMFGGNHFLEMQYVSEITDEEKCRELGIKQDDIVIMFHTGGGIIPGFIGGYFSRRTKGYNNDFRMIYNKLKFHFRSGKDFWRFSQKWYSYFSAKKFVAIPAQSIEGRKQEILNQVAMNYGYAYRIAVVARIKEALEKSFTQRIDSFDLICDKAHNIIQKEIIEGKQYWTHRHNACRIKDGEIGLLPGMNNTSSYIIAGDKKVCDYLNTIPHGAGDAVHKFIEIDKKIQINRKTMIFSNQKNEPKMIPHIGDTGVRSVVDYLRSVNAAKPVARLTPLAALKGFRPKY